jgi:hypothetical protein
MSLCAECRARRMDRRISIRTPEAVAYNSTMRRFKIPPGGSNTTTRRSFEEMRIIADLTAAARRLGERL